MSTFNCFIDCTGECDESCGCKRTKERKCSSSCRCQCFVAQRTSSAEAKAMRRLHARVGAAASTAQQPTECASASSATVGDAAARKRAAASERKKRAADDIAAIVAVTEAADLTVPSAKVAKKFSFSFESAASVDVRLQPKSLREKRRTGAHNWTN